MSENGLEVSIKVWVACFSRNLKDTDPQTLNNTIELSHVSGTLPDVLEPCFPTCGSLPCSMSTTGQILWLYPRPTESEMWGMNPAIRVLTTF